MKEGVSSAAIMTEKGRMVSVGSSAWLGSSFFDYLIYFLPTIRGVIGENLLYSGEARTKVVGLLKVTANPESQLKQTLLCR